MQKTDVGWYVQLARCVPAGLVESEHGVCASRDTPADLVQVMLHGFGIGQGKHERGTGIPRRTDGAEQIGVGVTLILRLARTCPLLGPLVHQAVLLPDPHFILEPDLDRRSSQQRLARYRFRDALRNVFLNASMGFCSCLGCWGRGLMWAKPSSLRMRPIDTSSRSTSKRSLMMCLRSTHRQRTTPSLAGSGLHSTIRFNSCFCSSDSFGVGAGSFAVDEPLGTLLVEAVHPVSQRLAVHCSNLTGSPTAHAVEHRCQRH